MSDGAAPVAYAVTNAPPIAASSAGPGALPVKGSQLFGLFQSSLTAPALFHVYEVAPAAVAEDEKQHGGERAPHQSHLTPASAVVASYEY